LEGIKSRLTQHHITIGRLGHTKIEASPSDVINAIVSKDRLDHERVSDIKLQRIMQQGQVFTTRVSFYLKYLGFPLTKPGS
jgi:hypothetical protein